MECNVGQTEQKLRVLAGMAIIGVGAYYNMKGLAALGLIPIVTGMLRYCPVNQAIGYNGCASDPRHKVKSAVL
jgi:ABC-type protease/lipase transport system fused ATPase/permease subunit